MEESRIKNTEKNLFYSISFQIVKIILIVISRIIFVKKLGATYLGINGLFGNILSVLSLADLGMTSVLMFSLYKPLAENDKIKIRQYMGFFKKIYYVIAVIIFSIGSLLIPFLKYLINLPTDIPNIYLYYILLLMNSVISYLFIYKTTLVSADQRMYILHKYDIIFQFILFVFQNLFLIFTGSFGIYLIINIICTLLSNIWKVKETNKIYPYLKETNNSDLEKKEKKYIFSNLKSLFLYKIGGVIQNNTDNILISVYVGTITVGYYSNYMTIILSITTFLTMFFTSIKASVGNYVIKEKLEKQLKLFNILEVYNYWIVSFCSICFMILIPDFIKICFGEEYILPEPVLVCIVLNFYTSNIRQTIWTYRETTGIFKKTKYITIVTSILNIFLSVIFGYIFGLIGIIGASVAARIIYAWWKEPIILYKDYFKSSPIEYFRNYIIRIFLMIVITIIIAFFNNIININNVYMFFGMKCIICLIIPTIIYYLLYKNSASIIYIRNKILKEHLNEKCIKN